MSVRSIFKFFLVLVCLGGSLAAFAQGNATIRGTITDPDSAVIPGATVTFTPPSGKALVTTSGADGSYALQAVPPGSYSVTVTMPGFASFVRQTVRLNPGQALSLNVKLTIQEQSQQVQVDAQSNQLSVDQDNNASSTVIKDKDLDALSDDPDELSSELSALAGPAAGPNGGQIYVDGFTGGQLPPKSSIREIRVNQNPFSAQFDKIGYGRIEVFTKPGTDKFHGNYSVQGGDKAFNTSNPFLGSANQQPDYHTLFMIGSVTGPINHFSSFSVGGSHRTIQDNSIVNPTGFYAATPNDTTPCNPGDKSCTVFNGYPVTARAVFHPQTRSDITPRIDLAIGDKNTLTARYQYFVNGQQNAGVGNTNLSSVGYSTDTSEHTVQLSDTQIVSPRIVNETRFEYQRDLSTQTPNSKLPTLSVQGIFTSGGSSLGTSSSTETHIEVQNYTSIQLAKHFFRLGGRLRTTSESLTSDAGSNGTFSYASLTDYMNNNINLFRQTLINQPTVNGRLTDVGLYAEDDWKLRPNLTVTLGLRYEAQNVINSAHDLAPRFAISYGIPRKNGQTTTVLRAGFGIFYDRFMLTDFLTTQQLNGSNQIQYVLHQPNSITCTPAQQNIGNCISGSPAKTQYTLGGNIRSSYNEQAAVGVDQQIGRIGSVSVNYITARGIHQYLSRAFITGQGTPNQGYDNQFQSNGYYREDQLLLNSNIHMRTLTLFGFYSLNFANANTSGSTSFATDPYNSRTDYGRASFAHRGFAVIGGSWQLPYNVSLSPFLIAQSGTFYNITSGTDTNLDGQINDRPFYAQGSTGSCFRSADYSLTNTNGNLTPVPVNSCVGPANSSFNLRVGKTIGFGPRTQPAAGRQGGSSRSSRGGSSGGPGGGGSRGGGGHSGGPGGGGPGGMGGGTNTGHRYNLTLGAQGSNIFNAVPYGTPNSVVSSGTRFGQFTTLAGRPFSSPNAVRSITLQANFTF